MCYRWDCPTRTRSEHGNSSSFQSNWCATALLASARAAFAMGPDTPVVQLGWIDFGGDGATFGLIEARQPGARYSKNLPVPTGGVLITNCIAWTLDQRFATNTFYRRPVQFLNPFNVLRNPGDSFDLARAPELAVKGITVDVVATQVVEGDAQVYRVKVTRQNAEFVDLYFGESARLLQEP